MWAELQQLDVKTCGVYTVVCELMFLKGGAIPDDDGLVMNYLHGCNVRTWHTSRDHLLGCLSNLRVGTSKIKDLSPEQVQAHIYKKKIDPSSFGNAVVAADRRAELGFAVPAGARSATQQLPRMGLSEGEWASLPDAPRRNSSFRPLARHCREI
jgi:hypothetical protein